MVGVRDPVRAGARLGDDRVLVQRQRRVARAGEGEDVRDRLRALRVRDRVPPAVVDAELDVFLLRDPGEQLCPGAARGADLEVWRARAADRAAAEQRAAQIRAATARARRRPAWAAPPAARAGPTARPRRAGLPARAGRRPHGAGTASRVRRRGGCTCGSRPRRRTSGRARTRGGRPQTRRGRDGRRTRRARGGAGCRQCGRGRRARPAGRSASAARPRRARGGRPQKAACSSSRRRRL